jgi:CHAT domain-containing protein
MPNLILSLWEVADRSTADLMQDFHQLWHAGKNSIPQALQQAQTKAVLAGAPIHAWAPFVHLGID